MIARNNCTGYLGWAPVSEEDGSGTLERTYIGGLGHADGTNPATGAFTHYMHDHLGSVRGAYGQGGAALGAMEHDPYGGAYFDGLPPGLTHRYTGHQWDGASALYYAPYRYYAPAAGRWMTRDPLGMVDGPNVYAYVGAKPLQQRDPFGLCGGEAEGDVPPPCEFYKERCARTGCKYYCYIAPLVCNAAPSDPWSNCVRTCLIGLSSMCEKTSLGCPSFWCLTKIHVICWSACLVKVGGIPKAPGYDPTNPNRI